MLSISQDLEGAVKMAKLVLTVSQPQGLPDHVESNYFRQTVRETFGEQADEVLKKFWKILGPSSMLRLGEGSHGIYPWDILAVMNRISIKVIFVDEHGKTLKFDPSWSGAF
jgi:hypothetical protein